MSHGLWTDFWTPLRMRVVFNVGSLGFIQDTKEREIYREDMRTH